MQHPLPTKAKVAEIQQAIQFFTTFFRCTRRTSFSVLPSNQEVFGFIVYLHALSASRIERTAAASLLQVACACPVNYTYPHSLAITANCAHPRFDKLNYCTNVENMHSQNMLPLMLWARPGLPCCCSVVLLFGMGGMWIRVKGFFSKWVMEVFKLSSNHLSSSITLNK